MIHEVLQHLVYSLPALQVGQALEKLPSTKRFPPEGSLNYRAHLAGAEVRPLLVSQILDPLRGRCKGGAIRKVRPTLT